MEKDVVTRIFNDYFMLVFLFVCDIATTMVILTHGGYEMNPFVSSGLSYFSSHNFIFLVSLKMSIAFFLLLFIQSVREHFPCYLPYVLIVLKFLCIVYLVVFLNNLYMIYLIGSYHLGVAILVIEFMFCSSFVLIIQLGYLYDEIRLLM